MINKETMDTTLAEIGEEQWLKKAQNLLIGNNNPLSTDDDAYSYAIKSENIVVNVDGFVASTDKPEEMTWYQCGYKSVVSSVSDIVAKGARPKHLLVSLNLPNSMNLTDSLEIIKGINHAARTFNLTFKGGDLNDINNDVVIDTITIGEPIQKLIPRHAELLPGYKLYWIGPKMGLTGLSLDVILNNKEYFEEYKELIVDNLFLPKLQLEFLDLFDKISIMSSMDSSDGIAKTLHSIKGNMGINLNPQIFTDIASEISLYLQKIHKDTTVDRIKMIFHGGEEFGIIFSSKDYIPDDIIKIFNLVFVGEIHNEDSKITITIDNVSIQIENKGWNHFLS
jgi:thiamine-monophosphate kinase